MLRWGSFLHLRLDALGERPPLHLGLVVHVGDLLLQRLPVHRVAELELVLLLLLLLLEMLLLLVLLLLVTSERGAHSPNRREGATLRECWLGTLGTQHTGGGGSNTM